MLAAIAAFGMLALLVPSGPSGAAQAARAAFVMPPAQSAARYPAPAAAEVGQPQEDGAASAPAVARSIPRRSHAYEAGGASSGSRVTGRAAPRAAAAEAIASAREIERAFQAVADSVSPSVVGIRVQRRYVVPGLPQAAESGEEGRQGQRASESGGRPGRGDGSTSRAAVGGAADDSGGADGGASPNTFEQWVVVNGSGMVLAENGLILTNEHVVHSAAEIEIALWDGRRLPASVVSSDTRSDLAVLRIACDDLEPVQFADPESVRRGQWAIALGNPYGLGADGRACLSTGVVSNLGRRLPGLGESDDRFYHNMLQTTAAINPGNSGGALFNLRGEVIGIITAMHTRATEGDGVGFAIPMTPVKQSIVERLRRGRPIVYGYAGLSVRDPKPDERASEDPDEPGGAVVDGVVDSGPAAAAGVRDGDLLVALDGHAVQSAAHLAELIGAAEVGSQIAVELQRGPRSVHVSIEVAQRDARRPVHGSGGD